MTMPITADRPMMMARTAGGLWLISIVAGVYAELFVRGSLVVRGDAGATAARIAAAEPLFRIGFVADLLGAMAYLGVTLLLYRLLRPAGRTAALFALAFGLAGCAVMAANLVNLFAPIILLGDVGAPAQIPPDMAALALAFVRLHGRGYSISIAFFAIQVAAIGWLILRSRFVPRIFGLLFLVEASCNLVSSFGGFLALDWVRQLGSYILLPGLPAEGGFTLWLLLVGVDARTWNAASEPHRPH